MRFTITREKLQEGLAAVTPAVPGKTTLPVLANLLVQTTDKGIRISGTDLDIAVSTEVTADVEGVGAITIPARKLSEIARELPPAPVRISATGDQRITLECGRSKFKLLGLPKSEFPSFPAVQFDKAVRIPSGDLQKLIGHTAFAASTEESRPILNGVLWELRTDAMRMVATNGHRLAKMEVPVSGGQKADLIIPPKALEQIRAGQAEQLSGAFPREIQPLASEVNALIDSNRRIIERARMQVGNLAHSLKTPIAVLLNESLLLAAPQGDLVHTQAEAMQSQVQSYLNRARIAAQRESVLARTEAQAVLERLVRVMRRLNAERQFPLRVDPPGLVLAMEQQDVEETVGNLLENAARYARTTVAVRASMAPAEVRGNDDARPHTGEDTCEVAAEAGRGTGHKRRSTIQ